MRLGGKRAVVTGAAQGIGDAIARRLAAEGARVALIDLSPEIPLLEGDHLALACDVADSQAVDRAFARIAERFGGVDVLVNNAAVGRGPDDGTSEMFAAVVARDQQIARGEEPSIYPDQLIHMSDEGWAHVLGVNLNGAFYCSRAAVRLMACENIGGSIVNIASTCVQNADGPLHYVVSKSAVLGLTRRLALELAARGIRVNAVHPGPTRTPIMAPVPAEVVERLRRTVPLGRMAEPEEVAAAVAFLASNEASYVTGSALAVNGGCYLI